MHKLLIVLCLLLVSLVLAAPVGAQTTQNFDAGFKGNQPKKEAGACGALLCATGTIDGFGAAIFAITPTSFSQTSRSCGDVTAIVTVTLTDGSGTLGLAASGQLCFPGNSGNAPGALRSFGNPLTATADFTIVGGSGVFAGASGSGTASVRAAGAHLSGSLDGTLTLP
jgi:hypothetical protein